MRKHQFKYITWEGDEIYCNTKEQVDNLLKFRNRQNIEQAVLIKTLGKEFFESINLTLCGKLILPRIC